MRRWSRSIFSIVIIRQRPADAPAPTKLSRLEKIALLPFIGGLILLGIGGWYDTRAYEEGHGAPDATHSIVENQHGRIRYKSPELVQTAQRYYLLGWSLAGPAIATFLICDQLGRRRAARQNYVPGGSGGAT